MKSKPDDRSDNVKKIQRNIQSTVRNMEAADDLIGITDDPRTRNELKEKNERRKGALDSLRSEVKDEAAYQRKKHQ